MAGNEDGPEKPGLKAKVQNFREWIDLRFGVGPVLYKLIFRREPKTPWYYGGGATLLLLLLTLVVTGCFLSLDYSASPSTAYESVLRITRETRLGWFVRALHYWAAGMMVVMLLYHTIKQVLIGGYLPPREGTWLVGVGIFGLVWANAFSGYTLRWDERALYAIRVLLNILHQVPGIGDDLVLLVQGQSSIGSETLARLYSVHVLFVPFGLFALVGYHLYLVVLHGSTTIMERKAEPTVETAEEQKALHEALAQHDFHGVDFHPETTAKSATFALVIFFFAYGLAWYFGPQELYPKANLVRDSVPEEEWWFHWFSALAAILPPVLAPWFYIGFPLFLLGVMLALPFVDHGANRGLWRRPVALTTMILGLSALLALTELRVRSPWMAWPSDRISPLPPGVTLAPVAAQGRKLFTEFGCNTCHAIGGQGHQFGPNLSGMDQRLSKSDLVRYISEPPEGIPMPGYGKRLSPDQLNAIAEFVLVAQTFPKEFKSSGGD